MKLPTTAPRGKAFAVVRMARVAGGRIPVLLSARRWTALDEAEGHAASLDARLSPAVVLVDEARAEEVRG